MNEQQIWSALVELSKSNGFYGRLCKQLEESGQKEAFLSGLAAKDVKDVVELVLLIES